MSRSNETISPSSVCTTPGRLPDCSRAWGIIAASNSVIYSKNRGATSMRLTKTPGRRTQETTLMPYPTPSEVEQSLKQFAEEIGDTTESPFRVDVVARYGGKPPLYTVMIRCAEKEPIRQKLSQLLNRSFSLGGTSFALN